MATPRLAVLVIASLLFFDGKFGSGRLVGAFRDEATRVGYWLNNEFDSLSNRITRFH
jgi:hypothetical protein